MTEQSSDQPPVLDSPDEGLNPPLESSGGTGVSRLWRRTAGAAAVVAVLVIGNVTVNTPAASASSRTGTTTASTPAASTTPEGSAASGGGAPSSAALHGEFKVINRDGSAQLRRWQSGTVDAIDEISMTVRSADGFDSDYLLGPGVSVTGIDLGDEVTIVGAGQSVDGNS